MIVSGWTMVMAFNTDGNRRWSPDEEQSVGYRQLRLRGTRLRSTFN